MVHLIAAMLFAPAAAHVTPQQVQKTLTAACVSCHSGAKPAGKLRLDSLTNLARGGASGSAVVPGQAAQSALYTRVVSKDRALRMPPAGAPLSAASAKALADWIDAGAPGLPAAAATIDYTRDIEPLLKQRCLTCHTGPKAGRLFAAVGTGGADSSRLVQRIEGRGGEPRMPLNATPLSAAEIATVRRWIDAGAKRPPMPEFEKHWSYKKPVRPSVPAVKGTVANPIDNFVLAKLEAKGLGLSTPASKETLIRRVSLDLIGLPPSPAEVAAFVADARPDAYERLVDRLLASPHYGERWARHWLDLARYADTHGYEKDDRRTIWKFRDWVIAAFNADMPYDQFTVEQLAGDMLPNATEPQKIATGFHRNTMFNEEGGVDKDEAYFEVLVDRVNTTATVWLGSTIGCAQCHTHKYDPFTHKEYYQLMAFFANNTKAIQPNGTGFKYREPALDLATPEQDRQREQIRKRIEELEDKLKTHTAALAREQDEWERKLVDARRQWKPLQPRTMKTESGTVLTAAPDSIVIASGENPQGETYTIEAPAGLRTLSGLRLEVIPDPSLPRGGPGRDVYGHFALTDVHVEINDEPVRFKRIVADDGRVLAKGTRQLWTIDVSREEKRLPRQLVLAPEEPVAVPPGATLRVALLQHSDFTGQTIGRFRLSVTSMDDPTLIVKLRPNLRPVLESAERSPKDARELAAFFRTVATSLEPVRDEIKELRNELDKLGIVTAMVMQEAPGFERPFDYVRVRGAFASKSDKVYADVPAALGTLPASEMPNRLGLARWLVSRDNPLSARVAVNRIWEHYFGRGIVETTEDFGVQGERPTHPELLDWLAVEFMEGGWRWKALHRKIVLSNAYRQSSHVTPALLQVDPYNRLISRGPRFRLEAELIRDSALAASGLLSRKIGGPSVFPPQPPGVWDIPYNDDKWEESEGEDRYRRGIYTFIRRTALYPAMMNFDATSREFCTVRRSRTNSPLAALTTLNDASFFEMAQALARRIVKEGGATDSSRTRFGFQLVTARQPSASEEDRLLSWVARERTYFAQHAGEAESITRGEAELAPWTVLANVLLNLDEALTKE